jgi:hypothetical protein
LPGPEITFEDVRGRGRLAWNEAGRGRIEHNEMTVRRRSQRRARWRPWKGASSC